MKKIAILTISTVLLVVGSYLIIQIIKTLLPPKKTLYAPLEISPITQTTPPIQDINHRRDPEAPTPQKKQAPDGNTYACDPQGVCNAYKNAQQAQCPTVFTDQKCDNQCGDLKVRCLQ